MPNVTISLDVLWEGRSICGLGIGWSKDEYHASNIPFKDRGKRADEFVQVLKRIWVDDVVEFKGKFYNIPASKNPINNNHKSRPKISVNWNNRPSGQWYTLVENFFISWINHMGVLDPGVPFLDV